MDSRYINVKKALKYQSQTDFFTKISNINRYSIFNIKYQSGGYSIFNIKYYSGGYPIFKCKNLIQ